MKIVVLLSGALIELQVERGNSPYVCDQAILDECLGDRFGA
jgi:hypothetical protein